MKKILAFFITLTIALGAVHFAYRISHERPQPALYIRLSFDAHRKELSLFLTNIGKREILVPVGAFSIIARPSALNRRVAVLHVRLGMAEGNDDDSSSLSVMALKPGEATRIDGLYRSISRLPAECDLLYSVFEVSDEIGQKVATWHGVVRSFPVELKPEKK